MCLREAGRGKERGRQGMLDGGGSCEREGEGEGARVCERV